MSTKRSIYQSKSASRYSFHIVEDDGSVSRAAFTFQYPPQEIAESFGPEISWTKVPTLAYQEPTYLGGKKHELQFDILLCSYGYHNGGKKRFLPLFDVESKLANLAASAGGRGSDKEISPEQLADRVDFAIDWLRSHVIQYATPEIFLSTDGPLEGRPASVRSAPRKMVFTWGSPAIRQHECVIENVSVQRIAFTPYRDFTVLAVVSLQLTLLSQIGSLDYRISRLRS